MNPCVLYPLLLMFLASCSSTYLTIKSRPEGASVYVVPKVLWDSDSLKYSDPANLSGFIIKDGVTPVYTIELDRKKYAVVLVNQDRKKVVQVDLSKGLNKEDAKTVEIDLN
jgi:hypothetical protein